MHNANLIQMGATRSNVREVDNNPSDPATFKAGLFVNLASTGLLTLTRSAGSALGVSLGRSLSNTKRTAVCRKGLGVPVLLDNGFTPVIGAQVQVHATSGLAVASGTGVNAVYASSKMSAVDEDGVAIADGAAYIDFQGGL